MNQQKTSQDQIMNNPECPSSISQHGTPTLVCWEAGLFMWVTLELRFVAMTSVPGRNAATSHQRQYVFRWDETLVLWCVINVVLKASQRRGRCSRRTHLDSIEKDDWRMLVSKHVQRERKNIITKKTFHKMLENWMIPWFVSFFSPLNVFIELTKMKMATRKIGHSWF